MDYEQELKQLFEQCKEVRQKQKAYFKTRGFDALREAQQAEKELDENLRRLEGKIGEQMEIF